MSVCTASKRQNVETVKLIGPKFCYFVPIFLKFKKSSNIFNKIREFLLFTMYKKRKCSQFE